MFPCRSESDCRCGSVVSGLTLDSNNSGRFKTRNPDANEDNLAFSLGVAVRVAKSSSGDKEMTAPLRPQSSAPVCRFAFCILPLDL